MAMMLEPLSGVLYEEDKETFDFAPHTLDMLREQVYNDGKIATLKPATYKGEITPAIEKMLEAMNKLTKLKKVLEGYDTDKEICYVQPYFNDKQHFRCYVSTSYIVVSVNPSPINSNWIPIIENHGADDKKNKNRYYDFSIIHGLDKDEHIEKITEGIECVVETVELFLFDVMNQTKSTYECIKHIRIGTESQLKSSDKIKKEIEKKKNPSRLTRWWNGICNKSDKISFS